MNSHESWTFARATNEKYTDMDGRGQEVLAVAILFGILTWLTVSLRVYVRAIMLKAWGWDDWTMLATLVSTSWHSICTS